MDSTRISVARALELGVTPTWREVAAIVHRVAVLRDESAARHTRPMPVSTGSCLITRGGDVVLGVWAAADDGPDPVVQLLEDLLKACKAPGELASLRRRAHTVNLVDELEHYLTPERRRIQIAGLAIRGLAADAARVREARDSELSAASESLGVLRRRHVVGEQPPPEFDVEAEWSRPWFTQPAVVTAGAIAVPVAIAAAWWYLTRF